MKDAINTPLTLHEALKDYLAIHSLDTPNPEDDAIIFRCTPTTLTEVHGAGYYFIQQK